MTPDAMTTFERTLMSFLRNPSPTKYFAVVKRGRFMLGHCSKHLTPQGCRYNRLIRLRTRLLSTPH